MRSTFLLVLLAAFLGICQVSYGQGMAVNATGSAAHNSAVLDASSTTQGMLIPRMTNTQRNAIASPATGLMIYQTDGTAGFYFYNGSAWTAIGGSAASTPTGVSPSGIPYTVIPHTNTTTGALYFSPLSTASSAVATAAPPHTAFSFTNCHPTLKAYGAGSSSSFPLTVSLISVTYSTSAVTLTAGSSLGSCVISSAGGTCTIDQSGATVTAGTGVTIAATSAASPIILHTAFSCN